MAYQHILVPVDGSQISFSAVKQAAEIAKVFGSQLTLISLVAEDPLKDADFYYTSPIMKDYFIQAYNNVEYSPHNHQASGLFQKTFMQQSAAEHYLQNLHQQISKS